jgi:hypothetical protein
MVGVMTYINKLEAEALVATQWEMVDPNPTRYVCALLPNFFILYFGQKPPTGDITSDDVKLEFLALGKGYDAWCTGALSAITDSEIIAQVQSNLNNISMVTPSHGSSNTATLPGRERR